ncbi:hypothetical protein PUNSTDRAFT_43057 [Punctularia strigosozonata HHB-11173 SS5]|uniref:uncharacterized protein n=1 Tax=Punctularia strigosozonata (strain HHB-11173) TaxID=741275 RepID=UPI00044162F5|nr:uncharacterized protein PUNSTDRAFT_43057 [Punctularia strigosozonata HHB-11173 SS5]EIN11970.1 hypothetical protein PUNSTDRAFT_43057 [Punctularia strigosozonata HHB-11173 SS5]
MSSQPNQQSTPAYQGGATLTRVSARMPQGQNHPSSPSRPASARSKTTNSPQKSKHEILICQEMWIDEASVLYPGADEADVVRSLKGKIRVPTDATPSFRWQGFRVEVHALRAQASTDLINSSQDLVRVIILHNNLKSVQVELPVWIVTDTSPRNVLLEPPNTSLSVVGTPPARHICQAHDTRTSYGPVVMW